MGIELVAYGVLVGEPLDHVRLEHIAANEVLAPGMNYRYGLAFLKGMFVTPYEYGITSYLLVCSIALAVATGSRSALLLAGWVIVFFIWLRFGFDPFGRSPRLKPQLSRYLLDLSVPMCTLCGRFLLWVYRRISRALAIAVCLAGTAIALACIQFDVLNYEAAYATRVAINTADRANWFPLYTDLQSFDIANFMLYDLPQRAELRTVQDHNFLTGETTFGAVTGESIWRHDHRMQRAAWTVPDRRSGSRLLSCGSDLVRKQLVNPASGSLA